MLVPGWSCGVFAQVGKHITGLDQPAWNRRTVTGKNHLHHPVELQVQTMMPNE